MTSVKSQHSRSASQSDTFTLAEQDSEANAGVSTHEGAQEYIEKDGVASGAELKDPNIVNWDGPDDPENPLNWPTRKKFAAIGTVSLITMLSPLSSTIISPSTNDVLKTFQSTNETLGAFVTTSYLIGYCFGPLVIAPMSELYGRAPVYYICNTIFLIFNIACAVANNLGGLIVFRVLAGVGASCPLAVGAGSIADMVPQEKRGAVLVAWVMGPVLGPTFGPLIGAYLAEAKGWRWIFWFVSICGGAVWLFALFAIRESNPAILLHKKTLRLIKERGNNNLRSALKSDKTAKETFKVAIFRPLKMLFFVPIVTLLSLYMAIVYGYLYLLFTTFPRVFQDKYHFSNGAVGLVYLGSGVGSFISLIVCGATSDRLAKKLKERNGGESKPEYRLPLMALGTICIPAGLFMYGWSAQAGVHWIVPIIGTAFVGAGLFFLFMPASTFLVDAYTSYAASATAAGTVFRSLVGALLPLAGNSMYNALGIGWGTSLLGFIAVAFIPIPFLFWTFGERLRNYKLFNITL